MSLPHKDLTGEIINAAMKVHLTLGIGFLESIYENALYHELRLRGFKVERQVEVPVFYETFEVGRHRLDLVVDRTVVVELKASKGLDDAHVLTVKSYLAATRERVALLINFGTPKLQVKRVYPSANPNNPFSSSATDSSPELLPS